MAKPKKIRERYYGYVITFPFRLSRLPKKFREEVKKLDGFIESWSWKAPLDSESSVGELPKRSEEKIQQKKRSNRKPK